MREVVVWLTYRWNYPTPLTHKAERTSISRLHNNYEPPVIKNALHGVFEVLKGLRPELCILKMRSHKYSLHPTAYIVCYQYQLPENPFLRAIFGYSQSLSTAFSVTDTRTYGKMDFQVTELVSITLNTIGSVHLKY